MQTRHNSMVTLATGFVLGIAAALFFSHNAQFTPEKIALRTAMLQSADSLKASAAAIEEQYTGKVDTLQTSNGRLVRLVSNTRSELQRAKEDNKTLVELVDTLIAHANGTADTATRLADCDTLQTAVRQLVASGEVRDSLCDELASTLTTEVVNRDSLINLQQQQYTSLRQLFDQGIFQQKVLEVQVTGYKVQVKHIKAGNKVLRAGVLVLTGIATYSLLHH